MEDDGFDIDRDGTPASRGFALDALGYLPRALNSALDDLKLIADATRSLPALLGELGTVREELQAIRKRVESMDDEVTGMHTAVESIRGDFVELENTLHPLRRRGRRRRTAELAAEE